MRTKTIAAPGIAALLCAAASGIPALLAAREDFRGLLLAVPAHPAVSAPAPEQLERFRKEAFSVTWESAGAARASLPGMESAGHDALIIGTNSVYPDIMFFPLVRGAFFSASAWKEKQKIAVLNETAARAVFGSSDIVRCRVRIGGDTYVVTGVIRDGDEETLRIYVPSPVHAASPRALICLAGAAPENGALYGAYETYAKSRLKAVSVHEGDFDFYRLEQYVRRFTERTAVAFGVFICVVLAGLVRPLGKKARALFSRLRREMETAYFWEALSRRKGEALCLGGIILALALSALLAAVMLRGIISRALPWQDIPSLDRLDRTLFYPKIARLSAGEILSRYLFCAALMVQGIFFFSFAVPRRRGGADGPGP